MFIYYNSIINKKRKTVEFKFNGKFEEKMEINDTVNLFFNILQILVLKLFKFHKYILYIRISFEKKVYSWTKKCPKNDLKVLLFNLPEIIKVF